MQQNLSLYKIFLVVGKTGNITKASQELFISQPAISKAIKKLEDSFGVPLFIRTTRGVHLTYEGEILYGQISVAFDAISKGESRLLESTSNGMGQFKIGVSTTLCKYVLLPYLQDYISLYPNVRISIECQSTYETIRFLETGKIDIGLIGKPTDLKHLDFYKIGDIEDTFVASESYMQKLEGIDHQAETSILNYSELMLLNKENITRQYVDSILSAASIEPNSLLEVTSMDLLIEFAKIGLGIACVIKDFVKDELASGSLKEVPSGVALPKREIGFAYGKDSISSLALHNFIDFYKKN